MTAKRIAPKAKAPTPTPPRTIGYGRPPTQHQFQPGRSGNPKGRPRGAKSSTTIIRELMLRKIEVREHGKTRKVTVFEAVLLRTFENALKGDPKTVGFVLKLYNEINGTEPTAAIALPEHDQKILEEFTHSILKTKGKL